MFVYHLAGQGMIISKYKPSLNLMTLQMILVIRKNRRNLRSHSVLLTQVLQPILYGIKRSNECICDIKQSQFNNTKLLFIGRQINAHDQHNPLYNYSLENTFRKYQEFMRRKSIRRILRNLKLLIYLIFKQENRIYKLDENNVLCFGQQYLYINMK